MTVEPEIPFEEALGRIERIVEDLERGEPALSTALAKYEDGVKLLRRCYDLLDQAERAVAILTGVDDDGRPTVAPFDAAATHPREPDPAPPSARTRDRKSRTAGAEPPF
jgi:exodeoxyribonuclease VII small subunit